MAERDEDEEDDSHCREGLSLLGRETREISTSVCFFFSFEHQFSQQWFSMTGTEYEIRIRTNIEFFSAVETDMFDFVTF